MAVLHPMREVQRDDILHSYCRLQLQPEEQIPTGTAAFCRQWEAALREEGKRKAIDARPDIFAPAQAVFASNAKTRPPGLDRWPGWEKRD
jgi:hypothetical protein